MAKNKGGRPTEYTQERGDAIIQWITDGKPLSTYCSTVKGAPDVSTVYRWQDAHREFRKGYLRARSDAADTLADMIVEYTLKLLAEAHTMTSSQVNAMKVGLDGLKWVAAKLKPAAYGERIEVGGEVGFTQLTNDQLQARIINGAMSRGLSRDQAQQLVDQRQPVVIDAA